MNSDLLTAEQEKDLAQLIISAAVPWLKSHPWAVWVVLLCALLFVLSFIVGVVSDYIDGSKLKGVRAPAAYSIARRFGYFFRGLGKDVREFVTGVKVSSEEASSSSPSDSSSPG